MKTNYFIQFTITVIITAFVGYSQAGDTFQIHSKTLRSTSDELALIRSKAQSIKKNNKGYWEADFSNGLVFIYVPKGHFMMGNNALRIASK